MTRRGALPRAAMSLLALGTMTLVGSGPAAAAVLSVPAGGGAIDSGFPLQLGIPFPGPRAQPHSGVRYGQLRVLLHVDESCAVSTAGAPGAGPGSGVVDAVRIQCADRVPWLANLTTRDDLSTTFVTLDFVPVADGWAPQRPGAAGAGLERLTVDE